MLADQGATPAQVGALDRDIHLPGEWLSNLVEFIASTLPGWRDDPRRPVETGETRLTAQLCAHLNGVTRRTTGWDFLQFKQEEPDETDARRSIDLAVAPIGSIIWLESREYSHYETLLPIECKRLPTPAGRSHDEREYLYSQFGSAGGVQRFKAGHHAAAHRRAAMIGYIQDRDITFWKCQLDQWVDALQAAGAPGWLEADKLKLAEHNQTDRVGSLHSTHRRPTGMEPILLDHIWIEMNHL
ncbi:MAG: hypothetical protein QF893_17895 [Alphaproteobacteria bacterium]|nr:hypothetical protein [Alphaproteobacteria bacterium]